MDKPNMTYTDCKTEFSFKLGCNVDIRCDTRNLQSIMQSIKQADHKAKYCVTHLPECLSSFPVTGTPQLKGEEVCLAHACSLWASAIRQHSMVPVVAEGRLLTSRWPGSREEEEEVREELGASSHPEWPASSDQIPD